MELRPEKLPGERIYALDTVTLIYFLERHADFYMRAKALFLRIEANDKSFMKIATRDFGVWLFGDHGA